MVAPRIRPLRWDRRGFLARAGVLSAATVLGGCAADTPGARRLVGPDSPEVGSAERQRRSPDAAVREFALTAGPMMVPLGNLDILTSGYGARLPGPELRLTAGEVLRVTLDNQLADPTTIHWHGIALRNDMDGVPNLTQPPIPADSAFTYEFTAPHPGTYWYHPHVGMQLDRGLYAPLIVEDPHEPGDYDREIVLMLDDWIDGVGDTPEAVLARLQEEGMDMDMGGMTMGMTEGATAGATAGATEAAGGTMGRMGGGDSLLGGDAGDVTYPLYLINGKTAEAPFVIEAEPGERLRLRIINAGGDTAFRVAVGGHELSITHTDGFPVEPVTVDAVLIGMGERYDAIVTAGDGVFPIVAVAEGKGDQALAVLRTASGEVPPPDIHPDELDGRVLQVSDLVAAEGAAFPSGQPEREYELTLTVNAAQYRWFINGATFEEHEPMRIRAGERVRMRFENMTGMFHPMHLHGHTFQVAPEANGPRKDTLIVKPMEAVTIEFLGDNPGDWLLHCHNLYHGESGMMTTIVYEV